MEDTLCNISAFRYHRLPPQVIGFLPPFPDAESDKRRAAFKKHPLIQEVVGTPAHLLFDTRASRSNSSFVCAHLAKHEAPFGSTIDTPLGIKVSSPLYCLLQLAQTLPDIQLLMAMYEFCGSFTVFRPSPLIEEVLAQCEGSLGLESMGWRRVHGSDGKPTGLWSRPPLITVDELKNYAGQIKGLRGCVRFQWAANRVAGITASPFEAQLSILLSLPRSMGGEGMGGFENNARIALSNDARKIAGRTCCYADLLFEKTGSKSPLIIECQGKVAHGGYENLISDSDRATALKQMGFDVMLLTYAQISNRARFDIVRRLVARETGTDYREKNAKELVAEYELRRNLFIDWATLGS